MRYLAWAAGKLQNVHYGVTDRPGLLRRTAASPSTPAAARSPASDHLVIGLGSAPVPGRAVRPAAGAGVHRRRPGRPAGRAERDRSAPIAVVGGGQTGLEATLKLLDSGFTDREVVGSAAVVRHHRRLAVRQRRLPPGAHGVPAAAVPADPARVIEGLNPTGDALTPGALRALYQANYDACSSWGTSR